LSIRLEERAPMRAFWRSHFEVWELSGLTQREYCERHGLSLKNFANWRAQLKREDAAGPRARWGRYPRLRPMTSPRTKVRTKVPRQDFFRSPSSAAISSVKVSGEPAGRRRFSEEAKKRIVEETCCLGASVSAVARRYGVAVSLLFRWRQALGVATVTEGASFLPVKIADEAVASDASGGTSGAPQVLPPTPSIIIERPAPGIEIELVGGRRVRFDRDVDAETMKRVVAALEAGVP
jgi:transposase